METTARHIVKAAEIQRASIKAQADLIALQNNDDTEEAHGQADDILCDLLGMLGFKDVVEEYTKVEKWYA